MFVIHPYKKYSKSAKALAKALGGRRSHQAATTHKDIVINWGDSECPFKGCLNAPQAVALAANKLQAFRAMKASGVPLPIFATSMESVSWQGTTVVRHKLTGHSGEGIEICNDSKSLPDAPLYVQYIKKEQEFRIHIGRKDGESKIIAVQRKARDLSIPNECVNWQVRNHVNGFVFVREGANPNGDTIQAACDALRSLGLDFGAVDVIFNVKEGKPYVLEINTAPGLEGQTIEDYADFFRSVI